MNTIIGTITPDDYSVQGSLSAESTLSGVVTTGFQGEPYTGAYEVIPSSVTQVLETDGKTMSDNVTIDPIPSDYQDTSDATLDSGGKMLSGYTAYANGTKYTGSIPSKTSSDLAANGATVTAPAGFYSTDASKTVASGIAGTPTATKGSVSNHAVNVTPSVTNTTGYITGGTKTGTAVSVSASELVSGNKAITENGTHDVTNYASANVAVPASAVDSGTKSVSITQNGTTTEDVTGYASASITTNVPNSYTSSDEGKVVSNGSLVAQTSATYTENDTYDTTTINSVTVNVSGGGGDNLPTFISRGQLGAYTFTDSSIPDYCFYQSKFTSLTLPNVVTLQKDYVFANATIGTLNLPSLKLCRNNFFDRLQVSSALSLPELTDCGGSAFQYCNASTLSIPKFVKVNGGQTVFKGMSNLTEIVLPACTTPGNYSFEACSSLQKADFTVLATVPQGLFNQCRALDVLILRNSTLVSLANVNAFNNMNNKAVTVYVPSALVSTYESATNWSSVTTATLTFTAIEGTQYENYYADGTEIPS